MIRMRRILREPLLHFLLLGALLFAAYGLLNRGLSDTSDDIVVSPEQVEALKVQFTRLWQRPAMPEELNGLIEGWIKEEIFYREGLAMGLDRNDPVVRRRVAQKLEFVADGQGPAAPTAAELQAWLDAHRDRYRVAPRYSLRQVYFDPLRRAQRVDTDIATAKAALQRGADARGDSTMLPARLDEAEEAEVARQFGAEFADALANLPVGGWQGPVKSGFGLHLVEIRSRDEGRPAILEEVRAAVERDLLHARAEEAKTAWYAKLRANYKVRIDGGGVVPAAGAAGR
jgi:hypothetical protein